MWSLTFLLLNYYHFDFNFVSFSLPLSCLFLKISVYIISSLIEKTLNFNQIIFIYTHRLGSGGSIQNVNAKNVWNSPYVGCHLQSKSFYRGSPKNGDYVRF